MRSASASAQIQTHELLVERLCAMCECQPGHDQSHFMYIGALPDGLAYYVALVSTDKPSRESLVGRPVKIVHTTHARARTLSAKAPRIPSFFELQLNSPFASPKKVYLVASKHKSRFMATIRVGEETYDVYPCAEAEVASVITGLVDHSTTLSGHTVKFFGRNTYENKLPEQLLWYSEAIIQKFSDDRFVIADARLQVVPVEQRSRVGSMLSHIKFVKDRFGHRMHLDEWWYKNSPLLAYNGKWLVGHQRIHEVGEPIDLDKITFIHSKKRFTLDANAHYLFFASGNPPKLVPSDYPYPHELNPRIPHDWIGLLTFAPSMKTPSFAN